MHRIIILSRDSVLINNLKRIVSQMNDFGEANIWDSVAKIDYKLDLGSKLGIIDLDFFEGHNVEVNLDLFKRFIIISSKNEIPSRWYSENTIDILKKPINLLRIKSAFNKVSKSIGRVNKNTKTEQKLMQNIELPGHLKKVRRVNKIAFIQRLSGNRLDCVRTLGFNTTATPNLLSLVKQSPNFMWVHDNYIVNKRHIKCQESSQLSIAGKTIPIGSEFKAVVD